MGEPITEPGAAFDLTTLGTGLFIDVVVTGWIN